MVRKLQMGVAAPWLEVSILNNKIWRLADRKPQNFTMIVFYRGGHCPGCQAQLTQIDTKIEEFNSLGIDVIAISGDSKEKAEKSKQEWGINQLLIGYGNSVMAMQRWGIYISRGAYDGEPSLFNEPAIFLVRRDRILHGAIVNSAPFSRPHVDDLLSGIKYILQHDYPIRGTEA